MRGWRSAPPIVLGCLYSAGHVAVDVGVPRATRVEVRPTPHCRRRSVASHTAPPPGARLAESGACRSPGGRFVPSGAPSSAARPPLPLTRHPPRPCACWAAPASSRARRTGAGGNQIPIGGWTVNLLLVGAHRPRRWSRWATLSRRSTRRWAAAGAARQRGCCRRASSTSQRGRWPLGNVGLGRTALPSINKEHDGDHGLFHLVGRQGQAHRVRTVCVSARVGRRTGSGPNAATAAPQG